ncbi:hypothetical protein AC249_AIPGENE12722 [Exaiptasia diaphana]|nr:hypothetical protein AC249_AIPGENE12722 [Exaiptasia diaphana]
MEKVFVLVCLLGFFIVRGCQALPSFSMQNLKDADNQISREMELFIKKIQAKLSQECSDAVLHLLLNDSNLLPAFGTLYDLLETPLPSTKPNEENVVQNDTVVHEDTSFYSDRDALVNDGMSPSAEIVPRKKRPLLVLLRFCTVARFKDYSSKSAENN